MEDIWWNGWGKGSEIKKGDDLIGMALESQHARIRLDV